MYVPSRYSFIPKRPLVRFVKCQYKLNFYKNTEVLQQQIPGKHIDNMFKQQALK